MPLAIAANLHTPYRIEIGIENIMKAKIEDKHGKGKEIFDIKLLLEIHSFMGSEA